MCLKEPERARNCQKSRAEFSPSASFCFFLFPLVSLFQRRGEQNKTKRSAGGAQHVWILVNQLLENLGDLSDL